MSPFWFCRDTSVVVHDHCCWVIHLRPFWNQFDLNFVWKELTLVPLLSSFLDSFYFSFSSLVATSVLSIREMRLRNCMLRFVVSTIMLTMLTKVPTLFTRWRFGGVEFMNKTNPGRGCNTKIEKVEKHNTNNREDDGIRSFAPDSWSGSFHSHPERLQIHGFACLWRTPDKSDRVLDSGSLCSHTCCRTPCLLGWDGHDGGKGPWTSQVSAAVWGRDGCSDCRWSSDQRIGRVNTVPPFFSMASMASLEAQVQSILMALWNFSFP